LRNKNGGKTALSFSGMNCVSIIQRSDIDEGDIKKLEKIDYDDK